MITVHTTQNTHVIYSTIDKLITLHLNIFIYRYGLNQKSKCEKLLPVHSDRSQTPPELTRQLSHKRVISLTPCLSVL